VTLLLLAAGVAYMSAFWGYARDHFPAPLNQWGNSCREKVSDWCYDIDHPRPPASSAGGTARARRFAFRWLVAQVLVGIVIPAPLLMLAGRRLRDVGIGWPNALGRRLIVVSVVLSVPFGLWLLSAHPQFRQRGTDIPSAACMLLTVVPEHFLICGVYVAILLPGRRLPNPIPVAAVKGPLPVRALRWLGLAQPPASSGENRTLAWFGLTWASFAAILASGGLFWMVHIGKESTLEVILSLPGGVAVAYVTLRSRSIWTAIPAHLSLTLIPQGLFMLYDKGA